MKRDMDLVRKILLEMEKDGFESHMELEIEGYSAKEINVHLEMMNNAGLIDARDISSLGGFKFRPIKINWQGRDFIDAARNDNIWQKAKSFIKKQGVGLSLDVLIPLLKKYSLEKLGLQ